MATAVSAAGNSVALGVYLVSHFGDSFPSDSTATATRSVPITNMPPKRLRPGNGVEPEVIAERTGLTGDGEATAANEIAQPVKRRRGRPRKTDVSVFLSSFSSPVNNIHF